MTAESLAEATARLQRLDTCAVSDALDRLGLDGALGGFRRWGGSGVVAGRVTTVLLEAGPAEAAGPHLGTRALGAAGPDNVIVVANQGRTEAAAWGGLLTLQAHLRRLTGVIVDGALRDADEIGRLGVPVFGRTASPRTARGRFHEVATDVAVRIEGVTVGPGDLVVADGSGLVFVRGHEVEAVLGLAEEVAQCERRMAEALRRGDAGADVLGAVYERMFEEGSR